MLEILDIVTGDIILSRQQTTKVLTRLHGCAGRSVPLLFTYGINRFSHEVAHFILLGHPKPKNDRRISQPRQVSTLNQKEILVAMVTCSDAATVVLTENCDIYVLHEYQCRKIASKLVCCMWG